MAKNVFRKKGLILKPTKQKSLYELLQLSSQRNNDYDDNADRQAAIRLMNQYTNKKFVSFPCPKQSCVDIMAVDGSITAEVEIAKKWNTENYPSFDGHLHIPWRKGMKPGCLRDMALGKEIFISDLNIKESWEGVDVYYCQLSPDYLRAAILDKETIIEYTQKKYLRPFKNSAQSKFEHGNEFYHVPLSKVKFVSIKW